MKLGALSLTVKRHTEGRLKDSRSLLGLTWCIMESRGADASRFVRRREEALWNHYAGQCEDQ